jgi:hypothetical protein
MPFNLYAFNKMHMVINQERLISQIEPFEFFFCVVMKIIEFIRATQVCKLKPSSFMQATFF